MSSEPGSGAPGTGDRRWLVVGGAGQVGGALLETLGGGCAAVTDRRRGHPLSLDLAEVDALPGRIDDILASVSPHVVVIAAGMTHVEACEDDPLLAARVNRHAPAVIARRAASHGARCVYLSTEYVFDGVGGPYDEDATPRPLSAYGRSKLDGERAVLEADPDALVVRTTVVYGPEVAGRNFAYQLGDRLLRGATMPVPVDQVSTPTYNRDLAEALVALVAGGAGASGLVHLTGPERLSRAAFAERLADAAGLDRSLVEAVPTEALHQRAPRPLDAGLVSRRGASPMRTALAAVEDWCLRPRGRPWPSVIPQVPEGPRR